MLRSILQFFFTFILVAFLSNGKAQAPIAGFNASPLAVCIGSPINFSNTSTPGGSPIANYTWDFGDGFSATTTSPSHTYTSPGTYTITLVATATNGQADAEVKPNFITIYPKPIAGFTTASAGCVIPFVVTFTNTSSSGGFTYAWNFGNGQTSTLQNPPAQSYATIGSFNAVLTVTNTATGCVNTFSNTIVTNVFNAGIIPPTTICVGQQVNFQDNSTVGANNWLWNFGNGQTSTLENPVLTYATVGTYTVTLTSRNTISGCIGNTSLTVIVRPLPVVSFTANPVIGCAPAAVTFTSTPIAGTNYTWNFGDGTSFTGATPPAHTYTANGTYSVTLTATNSFGCSATSTQTNLINLTPPIATFSALPFEGCAPLSAMFTGSGTSPNPATNPIVSYQWIFGDGTTFAGQSPPAHVYPVGLYNITLTVTTLSGCIGTLTQPNYIQVGAIGLVDFSLAPSPECAKKPVVFTNLSVISVPHSPSEITYSWQFGDGQSSTLENPTHNYPVDTGFFDVSLLVEFRGCKDSIKKLDIVYIKPPISLFSMPTLFCNPVSFPITVNIDDLAKIGRLSDNADVTYKWGDGTPNTFLDDPQIDDANRADFSHVYTTYGTFVIEQVVINTTTGCADSTQQTLNISSINAGFTTSNDSVCIKSQLILSDASVSFAAHPLNSFSYAMGNGATVNGANSSYIYPNSGVFTIIHTVANSVGCTDTETITGIDVLALPIADVFIADTAGCAPFLVLFDNTSSVIGNGAPLGTFVWNFGDGSSTANQTTTGVNTNPSHTYTTQGVFVVSMEAIDVFGCRSNPDDTSRIRTTKPTALFTAPAVQCNNVSYTTVNTSTGDIPLTYQWQVDGTNSGIGTTYTQTFNENNNQPTGVVNHSIRLIVTDVNGCKDTLNKPLAISIPFANFSTIFSGAAINGSGSFNCPPVFASYTNLSSSVGTIAGQVWDFDNTTASTLPNPNNTFVFPGTYSPALTITDQFGCTDDTTFVDLLTISGPTAVPTISQGADSCGLLVGFELLNPTDVDSVLWTFGDGTTLLDSTATTHLYPSAGTYTPSVLIADALGCEVLYPLPNVVLLGNGILANFTADPTTINLGESIQFTDLSTNPTPIVTWIWNYGDGLTDTNTITTNPIHFYGYNGNLPVVLTVIDENGCKDIDTLFILVTSEFTLPNILTVNNDGINENFTIAVDYFKSYDMIVTNRWGNLIHEGKNQTGTTLWNGKTDGGEKVIDGVYFYILKGTLQNGEIANRNGFVTIVGN